MFRISIYERDFMDLILVQLSISKPNCQCIIPTDTGVVTSYKPRIRNNS